MSMVVVLYASGCGRLGFDDVHVDGHVDGARNEDVAMTPDARSCYGMIFPFCATGPLDQPVSITATLDTDNSAFCETLGADQPCVVVGSGIAIGSGDILAVGARPLVLVAAGAITVDGTLDLASFDLTTFKGPAGANWSGCPIGGRGGDGSTGGGGGAGGSFGSTGAQGGAGGTSAAMPGTGGAPAASIAADSVHGGCPGGGGGGGQGASSGGGSSGGAVVLIAGDTIVVNGAGSILASGMGGGGGASSGAGGGGAGGGGAGGLIVLDAPNIEISGSVIANGGGGGQGGGNNSAGAGGGTSTTYNMSASGGTSVPAGGTGGKGSILVTAATSGTSAAIGGGGGGGGGVGFVLVHGQLSGSQISPPPTSR